MEKFDEAQLKTLLLRDEKIQAIQMLMQQTNMELREAKRYIDDFCLREKIDLGSSEPSYSATMENGVEIYYRHENGNKYIVSKEESPTFLVDRLEIPSDSQPKKHGQNANIPNHKKCRKILVYATFPLLALCLFFLYRIYTSSALTSNDVSGLIASGASALSLYMITFLLWLDEQIAKRRKQKVDEIETPVVFFINGRTAKAGFWFTTIFFFAVSGILLWMSIVSFQTQRSLHGFAILACLMLIIIIINLSEAVRDYRSSKLNLHIQGRTICVYRDNDEIVAVQANGISCVFCGRQRGRGRTFLYPKAHIANSNGELVAEIFLDLPEYHMLKKYMIQQGISVTDDYNRF